MTRDCTQFYVDGAWADAVETNCIDVINPATERPVGSVAIGDARDVDRAVAAARRSFDSGAWRMLPAVERAAALDRVCDELVDRRDAIADLLIAETGLPRQIVPILHVDHAIGFIRYYADLIRTTAFVEDRAIPGGTATVQRLPVGVVAAIAPWNVPLLAAFSKIGPALAAGCSVVFKPSPETPLHAFLVAEAFAAAGLPAGVFNLVVADTPGSAHLCAHPDIDMVAFTGSTRVGQSIATACAPAMRRYALELGGNAAAIVLDDAPAELLAAGLTVTGLALNNGEACIAQRRVLVPRRRHDEIVELLVAGARALPIGDPDDPATALGPMINAAHRDRVLAYSDIASREGAVVATGGGRVRDRDIGYFVEPTVYARATNAMRIAREEIFGPAICVIPYDSEAEAIAIAQDAEFGLSSSVWTADPARGTALARRLRVGSVYVNASLGLHANVPFGGFGQSGVGRELGPEGLDEYLETQVVICPQVGAP
ncbi:MULTISPECIES: aldehyde dehydrogenase [unclassified Sphingomonas]|jgi:acyl-CoA reductase-like NAD-dependent aldehyde dehydrogenase|uniref:aldehyde dehydrogenase n=1 Tax=unclassified Sphingomonas TaxID=196159 RepID=UPI00082D4354|nr:MULTISPECIES: aldehyde dehydrogenase [unclassified Sphingomonas]